MDKVIIKLDEQKLLMVYYFAEYAYITYNIIFEEAKKKATINIIFRKSSLTDDPG
jgi:hypothetical protein